MADIALAPTFRELFGRAPHSCESARGRVNLIGDHTDYNGGYVLPTAIPQLTLAEVALRGDRTVRVYSAAPEAGGRIHEYSLGNEARTGTFIDYIQGVTQALAGAGHALQGFDLRISSTVPVGVGLASSAALEVSVLKALRHAMSFNIHDMGIALLGQRAENDLVGAPTGIMDQAAASVADEQTALFLDTLTLEFKRVPMPDEADLVVISSGVTHSHAVGEYRTRRAECERAAQLLGVAMLRELGTADLPRAMLLPEPLGRRVRHVVTENERVLAAKRALFSRDLPRLGELFYASHLSMRDDFEVSVPEVDMLVEIARVYPGVIGARLTGGGFGGSVVMFVRRGEGAAAADRIAAKYAAISDHEPAVLVPPPTSKAPDSRSE